MWMTLHAQTSFRFPSSPLFVEATLVKFTLWHGGFWGIGRQSRFVVSFLFKHCPGIKTFMCDRHHAQSRAIRLVYGDTAHVLNYCVHLARNIAKNTGSHSTLTSLFWKMRYERTVESETVFLNNLERIHQTKKT